MAMGPAFLTPGALAGRPSFGLRPVTAVEGAILDGFGDVRGGNILHTVHVGDSARHFQDAVVGARGKAQARHGALKQTLAVRRDVAVLANLPRAHLRVAVNLLALVAVELARACLYDAGANGVGGFAARVLAQFLETHRGHIDVNINAVEQRPGNLRHVALDERGRAGAFA
jgi:hypothetical protein